MKIISLITFAIAMACSVSAQSAETIKWYTIEEAQKLNEKTPRNILMDVYTDWCGWCKVMDKETFGHPVIAKYINENFYPVKFNAESADPVIFAGKTYVSKGKTHDFTMALGVNGYPAIAYFTGKLEMLVVVPGFSKPEQIEPLLHYIVEEKYKENVNLEDYKKTFTGGLTKK